MSQEMRRWVWPLGIPALRKPTVCMAADRPPLFGWNRYPRQVIGFGLRLRGNRYLSVLWAKPARWWR